MKASSKNSAAHFSYISAKNKYENKSDAVAVASFNMPQNCDPEKFWIACEKAERKNANLYKEFEISLPRELSVTQNKRLAKKFVDEFVSENPCTLAMHAGKNRDNPHLHLMFSMRKNDNVQRENLEQFFKRANKKNPARGGAAKIDEWRGKDFIFAMRKRVEVIINEALADAKIKAEVSCKSLKNQGIDRLPLPKIGIAAQEIAARGDVSKRVQRFDEVVKFNAENAIEKLLKNKHFQRAVLLQKDKIEAAKMKINTAENALKKLCSEKPKKTTLKNHMSQNRIFARAEKTLICADSKLSEAKNSKKFYEFWKIKEITMLKNEVSSIKADILIIKENIKMDVEKINEKQVVKYKLNIKALKNEIKTNKMIIKDTENKLKKEYLSSDLGKIYKACEPLLQQFAREDLRAESSAREEATARALEQQSDSAEFFADYEKANKNNDLYAS